MIFTIGRRLEREEGRALFMLLHLVKLTTLTQYLNLKNLAIRISKVGYLFAKKRDGFIW
jgi:hypothetical protein